jgi:hypothetical protein
VEINEVPKFLTHDPTTSTHSIRIADPTNDVHPYIIPLQLEGVVSFFEYSLPTSAEYEDPEIPHLELTAESPAWDPYDRDFAQLEQSFLDWRGHLISVARSDGPRGKTEMGLHTADADCGEEPHWKLSPASLQYDAADITDDDNFGAALEATRKMLVRTNIMPETYDVCQVHTGKRQGAVDYVTLAHRWQIPLHKAKNTVQRTMQRGVRTVLHPTLSRCFRTNDRMLRYRRMPCNLYSDTMFCPKVPSARGYKMVQIFATDFGWSRSYPMTCKGEAHEALGLLFAREGVPLKMIVDNAKEMKLGEFAWKCKEAYCYLRSTEPYSPWSNSAEREIRELKKGAARKLTRSGAPLRLWCFALEYESYVRSHTALDIYKLDGRVPETIVSGETADISPFCEFGFWDWVKFWDNGIAFPNDPMILGKYLGPSIDVGPAMTSRVMKANGKFTNRSTVRNLTSKEHVNAALFWEQEQFLASVEERWGPKTTVKDLGPDVLNLVPDPENTDPWEDDDGPSFPELDDELGAAEAAGDFLVNSEVLLPVGNSQELARVLRRKRDANGQVVGSAHPNPELDSRVYQVHFPDGRTEELAANVIAEAVYAQCDADGNQYVLLDAIVDYHKDPSVAVARNDQVMIVDGKKIVKRSTRGWELCCEWRDCSTSWQKLSDLKESLPLQVAEFAFAAQIADEPAFNWWVSWVLKKRDRIISLVKRRSARYHKRTHKYGIEIPKTVEEAYAIDKATGTTFWRNAIEMEMKNMRVAFNILADGAAPPPDHQFIRCHMIFDVKMEDFRRKAQLVAEGHATKALATLTYASVVSRETVRIALLMAALNDVDIWAADVLNAYITAPCREKIWTTLGKEFGDVCGKKAILVRELYRLKSSGAAFRAHLAGCMRDMGYVSCPADPDLWLKEQTDRKGRRYYSYILCYVDNLLVIHHNPRRIMDKINGFLPLKPDSVGPPEMYLGAKLKKKTFEDGTLAWRLSPAKYVQQAVKNVETYLKSN